MPVRQAIRRCFVYLFVILMDAGWNVARADCTVSTVVPVPAECTSSGANCGCLRHVAPICQPTGNILTAFIKRGACTWFGQPLIPVRPRLSVGGTYQTFQNGEIANYENWTADAKAKMPAFVLSGVLKDKQGVGVPPGSKEIEVQWDSTSPFSYEFFFLRWDVDHNSVKVDEQHEDDKQQQPVKSTGTSGESVIDASKSGIYVIYVEGCVQTGIILKASRCDQGWSHPVYVDNLPALIGPVPLAPSTGGAAYTFDWPDPVMIREHDQALIIERLCGNPPLDSEGDHKGEITTAIALAKLHSANQGWSCGTLSPTQLKVEVNSAIVEAKVVSQPGTDVSGWLNVISAVAVGATAGAIAGALLGLALQLVFGGWGRFLIYLPVIGSIFGAVGGGFVLTDKPGDYDMRLTGLLQMVHRFPAEIDLVARTKLIDDLLTVRGPASGRRDFLRINGVPTPVLETENHLWMTESSRYLTNNLLADRYEQNGQPVPGEFDNDANGMTDWILQGLRLFLVQDFYELNSRPYATYILSAIQNLADYSALGRFCLQVVPTGTRCNVARAARNVLDFQATKFAVSSNGLRRAAPFRRQPDYKNYPRLLTNGGDGLAWHYLAYTGGSDFLRDERNSRMIESSDADVMQAFQSAYRPPVMVTDLLRTTVGGTRSALQRFHGTRRNASVVEVYYREPNFLISAGGKFDSGSGVAAISAGEDAWALPTTLMPTGQGNDYRDFVRITGHVHEGSRINTCVAPGFACGLNPQLPIGLPAACVKTDGDWVFINFADNTPDCPFDFGFYVALYSKYCGKSCDSRFGFFEATPSFRGFSNYVAGVLALNKSWTYEYDKINLYQSPTGRRTTFVYNAGTEDWGIVDFDNGAGVVTPERSYAKWPVADGDIMTSPVEACIMVDNHRLEQRLILDHTDVNYPRRTVVALPSECGCPLPDRCITLRAQ